MAFADTWAALQSRLHVDAVIQNWTVHSGAVGEPFVIEAVGQNVIVVNAPGATTPQLVRRADFEAVYALWDDYIRGATPRSAFTPLTRYSKYVVSILHWLQGLSGGRLP
jgi:hypothetical protein